MHQPTYLDAPHLQALGGARVRKLRYGHSAGAGFLLVAVAVVRDHGLGARSIRYGSGGADANANGEHGDEQKQGSINSNVNVFCDV